ncbi:META domain-containing protein [Abyssibacter profundi]|uniref:Heat-shock protein n=1 Tax=Abyssibacter profundi TaxID=2182787 RepID=A0A383XRC8_9GAMM|nr:META domain-containing protein [Abyssibacter profundi]MBV61437.1 heat-shock protein [Nevskiales bacterium]PWN55182.1 heat-shock protein [Abyssibacter profundi]
MRHQSYLRRLFQRGRTFTPLALLSVVLCSACATPVAEAPALALTGTPWVLVSLGGQPVDPDVQPATLVMETGTQRMYGHAGCNRMSGEYSRDNDSLAFSRLVTTKMACAKGMAQEQQFLQALAATQGHRVEAGRLVLLNDAGQPVATLMAEPSVG